MRIPKAIEILTLNVNESRKKMPPDCRDAVNLGIEALMRVDNQRNGKVLPFGLWLPSETKE